VTAKWIRKPVKLWTAFERLERQEKAKTSFEIWPLTFLHRNDCCADVPSQLLLANVPFENTIHDGMCDLRESEIGTSGTSVQGIISGIEKLENRRSKQYQKSRFQGQAHVFDNLKSWTLLYDSTSPTTFSKRPRPSRHAGGCFNEYSQYLGAWVTFRHTHIAQDRAEPQVTRRKTRSI